MCEREKGERERMEDELVCEYDSTWDTDDGDDLVPEHSTRRVCPDKNKKAKPGFVSAVLFCFVFSFAFVLIIWRVVIPTLIPRRPASCAVIG